MKDGEIVERGTHDELFGKGGIYYKLVNRQLQNDMLPGAENAASLG